MDREGKGSVEGRYLRQSPVRADHSVKVEDGARSR